MPVEITRDFIAAHAARFDDALAITKNEFASLDADAQYTNAFARLLKWDPLDRVAMLGTDQRELFVPVLKKVIRAQRGSAPTPLRFFDIGCGDGQTFLLVAEEFPDGATGTILDCNAYYLSQYEAAVRASGRLEVAQSISAPFLPETAVDGGFDLILAIHVLYYFDDLRSSLARIYQLLKPGGTAFIVFADEKTAYTGQALRAYHRDDAAFLSAFDKTCDLRRELLLSGATLQKQLDDQFPNSHAQLCSEVQASRLYGHTLADILALSLITGLDRVETPAKFDAVMELVRTRPDAIGLRIERGGNPAREGMLSVVQSQVVVELRRDAR
ncbi:MAG TPA: class I SAM-dependent methyltransferase [Stellaceae bacterium]|jgi:ubiquinone/menaquinone biosynthesis C-methylase UbiE|nr:class I SAM-dependent methyltransferase [Stellaceae bacterium]